MHKPFSGMMLLLAVITGIILLSLIVLEISWKIYILIYTDYTWGLLFPYAKFHTIVAFVSVIFILLVLGVIFCILKIRKR